MTKRQRIEEIGTALTKRLSDEGKLIEAGFAAFAHYMIAKDTPAVQREELRLAFMAGAEHVFSSVLNLLDEGDEPTADDLRRMELIQREIDAWRAVLDERLNPTRGSA